MATTVSKAVYTELLADIRSHVKEALVLTDEIGKLYRKAEREERDDVLESNLQFGLEQTLDGIICDINHEIGEA